jgi:hypothetical protein
MKFTLNPHKLKIRIECQIPGVANETTACLIIHDNNRDIFYVIVLFPHQLPGKFDPHRWHCQQVMTMWPLNVRILKWLKREYGDPQAAGLATRLLVGGLEIVHRFAWYVDEEQVGLWGTS